ncbi:MAG TPA: A24 family peptidase [Acetobacteraceae bacterium]|nr:A24 family peptidase [Acetobacteraceae bacterium]
MPDIGVTFPWAAPVPWPTWLAVLVAPAIGSLLGVFVERLPAGRPVVLGRSACVGCGRPLTPFELVPILSYLRLRGRCRCGAAAIGPFHLAIEIAAITIPLSALLTGRSGALLWIGCMLGWGLLALAWIDAAILTLPDALTLPLIPAGLLATWWLLPGALAAHAAAAILGYAAFALLRLIWRAWRGVEAMGAADAKLMAVAGAWLGLAALPDVVLAAGLLGLALAGALHLAGHVVGRQTRLPFGPPLALAIWGAWLLLGPG